MNIVWQGKNYFRIITKSVSNEQIVLSLDPEFKEKKDLIFLKSNIILSSFYPKGRENQFLKSGSIADNVFFINEPGEYEIREIYIKGIISEGEKEKNIIYTVESEGLKICHLGHIRQKELNSKQVEKIGRVNILMVPIDDDVILKKRGILNVISQLEPSVVIPMSYSGGKASKELKEFLKIIGQPSVIPKDKLSIKEKDLIEGRTQVIVLNSK